MPEGNSSVVNQARAYYDSDDADNFYHLIWGGEDIHVGIYEREGEPIRDASHRTVERLAAKISNFFAGAKVLDIGAGYGGAARHLARQHGFALVCLNLSTVQNERNRRLNAEQALSAQVDVVDGSFESLPFADRHFDAVWSQDAILHSGNRRQVFREVDRVLRSGGEFVFTDPMQRLGVDPRHLRPVLDRIHLDSMGSVEEYQDYARELGWECVEVERMPGNLVVHYSSVLRELEARHDELVQHCSSGYLERMRTGLRHWIDAGNREALDWGILRFRKPGLLRSKGRRTSS